MADYLSDILYEAHELGIRNEVLAEVRKLRQIYPSLPSYEVYELAFENVKSDL